MIDKLFAFNQTCYVRRHEDEKPEVHTRIVRNLTQPDKIIYGEVTIDGLACDALSEGGPVAEGVEIEAVRVEGRGLLVRPRAVLPPAAAAQAAPAPPEQPAQTGPLLSKTLEEFDFEQLDPPAA